MSGDVLSHGKIVVTITATIVTLWRWAERILKKVGDAAWLPRELLAEIDLAHIVTSYLVVADAIVGKMQKSLWLHLNASHYVGCHCLCSVGA